ncbi:hypothetical protein [Nonomuraea dietziae]|uniref:hypothetical protein n=1 Tax=Nonomuraea dietziae TaxID=65515 RepID=UPI0033FFA80D
MISLMDKVRAYLCRPRKRDVEKVKRVAEHPHAKQKAHHFLDKVRSRRHHH